MSISYSSKDPEAKGEGVNIIFDERPISQSYPGKGANL